MTTAWIVRIFESVLEQALEDGGATNAKALARDLRVTRRAGECLSAAALEKFGGAKSQTNSTRMKSLDRGQFLEGVSIGSQRRLRMVMRRYPPQHGRVVNLDGHEHAHWFAVRPPRRIPAPQQRGQHTRAPVAKNKPANLRAVHEWSVATVEWTHRRRTIRWPIHIDLLGAGRFTRRQQVEPVIKAMHRAGVTDAPLLMDRGYDAAEVRDLLDESGIQYLCRLRLAGHLQYRTLSGKQLRRDEILQALAQNKNRIPETRPLSERGELVAFRREQRFLYLGKSQRPCRVEFLAGIERSGKGWQLNLNTSMALASNIRKPRYPLYQLYRRRWGIETFFGLLTNIKGADRPKTIISHAVVMAANILLVATGQLQFLVEVLDQEERGVRTPVVATVKRAMQAVASSPDR